MPLRVLTVISISTVWMPAVIPLTITPLQKIYHCSDSRRRKGRKSHQNRQPIVSPGPPVGINVKEPKIWKGQSFFYLNSISAGWKASQEIRLKCQPSPGTRSPGNLGINLLPWNSVQCALDSFYGDRWRGAARERSWKQAAANVSDVACVHIDAASKKWGASLPRGSWNGLKTTDDGRYEAHLHHQPSHQEVPIHRCGPTGDLAVVFETTSFVDLSDARMSHTISLSPTAVGQPRPLLFSVSLNGSWRCASFTGRHNGDKASLPRFHSPPHFHATFRRLAKQPSA